MSLIAGIPIRDSIHTDFSTGISGWGGYRTELTGEFIRQGGNVSGRYGEFSKDIQEYNRKINTLSGAWSDTGMFLTPYNAGFRYTGTGDFNKWDTYSVVFDGVNDYIRAIEDVTVLDFIHTGAALSFWINLDAFPCTTQSGEQYWGSLGDNPFAYKAFFTGFRGTDCWMVLQGAQKDSTDVSSYITAGTWHHICMVADAGTATFYIDGVARDTMSYTPNAANNPDVGHFDIGMCELFASGVPAGPLATGWVAGKLDEVAIFKGALSAAQVLAIYNGGTPQSLAPYNPFVWWRMGEYDVGYIGNAYGVITDQMDTTLGSDLITNGDFATDSDWTKGAGWTISDGVASSDGSQSSNSDLYQNAGLDTYNTPYEVTFTVSNYSAGSVRTVVGGSAGGIWRSANGTYTEKIWVWNGPNFYMQSSSSFIGSIDNIVVKKINGYAGRMVNMTASDIVGDTP